MPLLYNGGRFDYYVPALWEQPLTVTKTMTLIPGRSKKQGTSLNVGKLKEEYLEVTSTLQMNEKDMQELGLQAGDKVRLVSKTGQAVVSCSPAKAGDLPPGMLFIPYGPPSCELMDSDTAGSGMPVSKQIRVSVTAAGN